MIYGVHHITLDTNVWIYLANGTEPVKLLHYLNQEVKKGYIKLILPEIIIKEWDTNKENGVRQRSLKHFKDVKETLNRLLKLLGNKGERDFLALPFGDDDDKDYFKDFIGKFRQKKEEIEDAVTENIELIDDLLKNHSIIISADEGVYKKAGDFALEKKAPFKLKNSFADALIIFTLFDYLKKQSIENAIFVTYNTDDFCEKKNGKNFLHSDLKNEFKAVKCDFFKFVGEALNTINEDVISDEELALIEQRQNEENWSDSSEFCEICENNDRLSEVTFGYPIELIDERVYEVIDPNQLSFEFAEKVAIPATVTKPKSIKVGHCDCCGTEHFICVDCETLNSVWQHEYGEEKKCEDCGLTYRIEIITGRKGSQEGKVYIILKDTETCQKCGKEFDKNEIVENLCGDCEQGIK
jgi:hypothetical protein